MDPLNLKKLNQERRSRRAALLLTDLKDGRDRVIRESDFVAGELGEAVAKAFRSGKSVTVNADGTDYFLNVHVPPPRVVAIGAVHISQALAPIARIAGYDIEIIDPRTAFATPERFEGTLLHAEWPEEVLKARPLDAYTAVAALTHDPKIDDFPIAEALRRNCFYVGALGSRKTHARRVERLEKLGIGSVQIERIHAPIGVDIGAASPQEIAVAVMAEIIDAFRKRGIGAEAGAAEAAAE
jgi:xanthine dehydrogenase accessory factor